MLNDKTFDVAVQIPQPFRGTLVPPPTDSSLDLTLDTPFGITFLSKPSVSEADLIPDQCALVRVSVSDTALS